MRRALAVVALALVAGGCGEDAPAPSSSSSAPSSSSSDPTTSSSAPSTSPSDPTTAESPAPRARQARCPATLSNCRTASGRIAFVEKVDPDGDGDAHFILVSKQSITAPGVSIIDVKRSLRPRPLPGRGDHISAAGPVYRGSFGQRQIEAVELIVRR